MSRIRRSKDDSIIYSVWIRRGPDIFHYDMVFEDDCIRLVYLGEHWERVRPKTGLQRRVDMFIYSIRKRRERIYRERGRSMVINYCDISSYDIVKPRPAISREDLSPGALELLLRNGKRIRIEFSPRVYEIVKSAVKKYVRSGIERCKGRK